MNIKVNNEFADGLLNVIRQAALTQLPSMRPIAFQIGQDSNLLCSGDLVHEDSVEFISNVTSLSFASKLEIGTILKWEGICTGILSSSEIQMDGLDTLSIPVAILHSSARIPVTIYFRQGISNSTRAVNLAFLTEKGINTSGLVVISSRHSDVLHFSSIENNAILNSKEYILSASSTGTMSENEMVLQAIAIVEENLAYIKNQIQLA